MLHKWDERYHALVAKNSIEHPLEPRLYKEHVLDYDYKNWTANKVWLHKQPVPLWAMALSMKAFGVHEFVMRLPSILLSTLSILLTFWICTLLFKSSRISLTAASLHAINGLVIELASGRIATEHTDTFFLFFIELSILFILLNANYKKTQYLVYAGLTCGLAILSKWLPALIIFPLYLILNYEDKSLRKIFIDLLILSCVTLFIALPWQLYTYSSFPLEYQWEQHFNRLHITQGLEGHGQPWWYFINRIRITINELIYFILIWFAYFAFKNKKHRRESLFLGVYILVPFIFFSIVKTKMPGYLLFTFPAYFIITALCIDHLIANPLIYRKINSSKLIVGIILGLAARYGIERAKPFKTTTIEYKAKKELLNTHFSPKSVLFNASCPIEVMFYTDCLAYPNIPDQNLIEQLSAKGYSLFIVDNENVPPNMRYNENIKHIQLEATTKMCQQ